MYRSEKIFSPNYSNNQNLCLSFTKCDFFMEPILNRAKTLVKHNQERFFLQSTNTYNQNKTREIRKTHGWATNDPLAESHRKGLTPTWTTANFSTESFTFKYLTSDRSNSNDSRHGALVTPVISRSTATKSHSLIWARRSEREDSKLDLVTFFTATLVEEVDDEKGRARVRVRVLKSHGFFISAASFRSKRGERG